MAHALGPSRTAGGKWSMSDTLAHSSGPSVQDLLAADSRPVPAALLDHSTVDCGTAEVPKSRYVSSEFAALENEYLWRTTWQMACHIDDRFCDERSAVTAPQLWRRWRHRRE